MHNKEQRIRREAAEFALASVRLEGLMVPAKTLADTERYIRGEITITELIAEQHKPLEEPCFMNDNSPSDTLPIPPHRTKNSGA